MYVDNAEFYEAQERYLKDRTDKAAWEKMFTDVFSCSYSCARKLLAGTPGMKKIDDYVFEAATKLLERYKKDPCFKMKYLEVNCWNYVRGYSQGKKAMRIDREQDIDDVMKVGCMTSYTPDFITDIENAEREKWLMQFAGADSREFMRVGFIKDIERYGQQEFDFGA